MTCHFLPLWETPLKWESFEFFEIGLGLLCKIMSSSPNWLNSCNVSAFLDWMSFMMLFRLFLLFSSLLSLGLDFGLLWEWCVESLSSCSCFWAIGSLKAILLLDKAGLEAFDDFGRSLIWIKLLGFSSTFMKGEKAELWLSSFSFMLKQILEHEKEFGMLNVGNLLYK